MKELKLLKQKIDGYVMKNLANGIVVYCTEKFVQYWERLGFVIVEQRKISLIS